MASLLTFVRPLRYDTVRSVLVVQSGPIDLALRVAARVRTLFPGCHVAGLVREYDHAAVGPVDFDHVTVIRWEDRFETVRTLRARRWDAVAILHSARESPPLRLLPYLLRTRAVLLFNDHLDYFPVSLLRFRDLARHLSGGSGLVRWLVTRAVVVPLALVVLLTATARIYLRAALRRT